MKRTASVFAFDGGLDTNSAALAVPPGALISGMNYEPLAEGYARVQGYERFDGRPAPSEATFWALDLTAGTAPPTPGADITGQTSGATAILLDEVLAPVGSWDAGTMTCTLLLVALTGTFEDGETLTSGGVTIGTCVGTAGENVAANETLRRTYVRQAIEWHRSQIAKVPGQGPVRGVAIHDGEVYAWRDVIGGAYCQTYRASPTGWQAMGVVIRLDFINGSVEPFIGEPVVGETSFASGIVAQVVHRNGEWSEGKAAGFIDVIGVANGPFQPERLQYEGAYAVEITTVTTQRIAAGAGRVRTISHNFYGAADRYRLYGTCESGKAFELIPGFGVTTIETGMVPDTPTRIFEIGNHLGLAFPGGSLQFSGTGEPNIFDPILGAGEIGFGTEITDVVQANETAVAIFGESKIAVLQGTDAENFALDTLTEEAGAEPDTALRIARTVYVDRRGLRSLDATQAFGNFKTGALSGQFERYFRVKYKAGAKPIGAYLSKLKSHYRLVWDDGTGIAIYMGGKRPAAIPFSLDDMRPYCFCGGEYGDSEGIFAGGEDGYVYRLDSGDSFDGTRIRGFIITPFNNFGNPQRDDKFFKVTLELEAPAAAHIGIAVQYDYGDGYQPMSGERNFTAMGGASDFLVAGGGGLWDTAVWDQFYWSAPVEARAEAYIDGIGRNASFIFATQAETDEPPHTLQAYIVDHAPRKMRR